MTITTIVRRLVKKNFWKFFGVTFMFFVTVLLFMSFDSEANEMKRLEGEITNKYKQQDAKIELFNINGNSLKQMFSQIDSANAKMPFEKAKTQVENKLDKDQILAKLNAKYGKDLDFEIRQSKKANVVKQQQKFKGMDPKKLKLPVNVYLPTSKISKYYMKSGKFDVDANHIVIDKFLAENKDLKVGDKYKIDNKDYTINGIYGTPSQIIMQSFGSAGSVMMSTSEFNKLDSDATYDVLAIAKNKDAKGEKYYQDLYDEITNDKDFVMHIKSPNLTQADFANPLTLQSKLNNVTYKVKDIKLVQGVDELANDGEANLIHIQPNIHLTIAKAIAIVFTAILAILLTVIISKIINNYAVEIGVLKSFGYEKWEILRRFIYIPVVISIIAITLGFILGRFTTSPLLLKTLTAQYNLPAGGTPQVNIMSILFGMVIPFVVILFSVVFNANKLIDRPTVYLLRDVSSEKTSSISNFFNRFSKKLPMKRLVRLRLLTNGMAKTIAVFIGLTFSSMLVFFAMFFASSINHTANSMFDAIQVKNMFFDNSKYVDDKDSYKSVGLANAIRIIDVNRVKKPEKHPSKFVSESKPKIEMLLSYKPKNTEFKFSSKQTSDMKNGIYLSSSYQNDYQYRVGDKLTVKLVSDEFSDKTKNNTYELKIAGFYDSAAPMFSFTTYNYGAQQMNKDGKVNAVFSDSKSKLKQLDLSSSATNLDLGNIKDQMGKALAALYIIVMVFGVIAFLILLPIILILSGIIIDDNRKNMGILKALGYTNNELGSMMINIYNSVVFLGILAGIGLGYLLTLQLFGVFAGMGMTIFVHVEFIQIILGALLIFVIYWLNIKIATRKIRKVVPIKELSSFT